MKHWLFLAVLLAGCSAIEDPHAPPPDTCTEIDAERAMHNARVARVSAARTAKIGLAYGIGAGVAIGALAPPLAVVPAILEAISIDTSGNAERGKFLAYARLYKDC